MIQRKWADRRTLTHEEQGEDNEKSHAAPSMYNKRFLRKQDFFFFPSPKYKTSSSVERSAEYEGVSIDHALLVMFSKALTHLYITGTLICDYFYKNDSTGQREGRFLPTEISAKLNSCFFTAYLKTTNSKSASPSLCSLLHNQPDQCLCVLC